MNSYKGQESASTILNYLNQGVISASLQVGSAYRTKLTSCLSNVVSIARSTDKGFPVTLEIHGLDTGYGFDLTWITTPVKAMAIQGYVEDIDRERFLGGMLAPWRRSVILNIQGTISCCGTVSFSFETEEQTTIATLRGLITFQKLTSFPVGADQPENGFSINSARFTVPHELIEDLIQEQIYEALRFFGSDHRKVLEILEPIAQKVPFADYLIGATYYMFLDRPNKAHAYLVRSLRSSVEQGLIVPAHLLDMLGDMEFIKKHNPNLAEKLFYESIIVGNKTGFLKLAYLYLQQARNDMKENALILARCGEQVLFLDQDLEHRMAGYHIVASVYLWNRMFNEAETAHALFLSDPSWCAKHRDLIEPYLLLAIALNNEEFIANLITDYLFLTKSFPLIFDCWHFQEINPLDKRFRGDFIRVLGLLEKVKEMYVSE